MGNFFQLSITAFLLLIATSAFAISDSLVSIQFESEVAQKVAENISQYKTVKQFLTDISTGNRNDSFYLADIIKEFGDRPMPKVFVVGATINMSYGEDKSQMELVSSLERAYVINEIQVQISSSESLQGTIEHLERVYKSRKRKLSKLILWQSLFVANAFADNSTFFEDHPNFTANASLWGALTVGMERKISTQAKLSLEDHAPSVSALSQSLTEDLGPRAKFEVSCRPRFINVNDTDKSEPYQKLLSQCCQDKSINCESVINNLSNAEHPSPQKQIRATASSSGIH